MPANFLQIVKHCIHIVFITSDPNLPSTSSNVRKCENTAPQVRIRWAKTTQKVLTSTELSWNNDHKRPNAGHHTVKRWPPTEEKTKYIKVMQKTSKYAIPKPISEANASLPYCRSRSHSMTCPAFLWR